MESRAEKYGECPAVEDKLKASRQPLVSSTKSKLTDEGEQRHF